MDQWFKDLFEIIGSQKKTTKMDFLLPELYSEFDILIRNKNISELKSIYRYIKDSNPVKTNDIEFNKKSFLTIKKEIMLRLVLLNDLSIIDEEMAKLLKAGNKADTDEFIKLWKDNSYVERHLREKDFDDKAERKKRFEEKQKRIAKEESKVETIKEPTVVIDDAPKKARVDSNKKVEVKFEKSPEPVKEVQKKKPVKIKAGLESFFALVKKLNESYKINLDIEKLSLQTNPRRSVYTVIKEYIDLSDMHANTLLAMIILFQESNEIDLINYLIENSIVYRKLCTLNAGILSIDDLTIKKKLVEFAGEKKPDYISLTIDELALRKYVDSLNHKDLAVEGLIKYSAKVAKKAPYVAKAFEVNDCIEYFNNSVLIIKTRIIDTKNITHLYWSMILAAYLSIYTEREYETDYSKCINIISEMASKMINLIDDETLNNTIKKLAKSYIRRAAKAATKSENYDSWWDRQKDDLLETKLEAISNLDE